MKRYAVWKNNWRGKGKRKNKAETTGISLLSAMEQPIQQLQGQAQLQLHQVSD